ncbi:MAG: pyruvate, phosphate dikinase, partial [Coriobacteriia bacterium]|nr:pyruvate, phosphate dikinase [Coriobacteriia bacterium]
MGAEGIGLCRTEHMFLGDRKQIVADMILAEKGGEEYNAALGKLYEAQQGDYYEILKAMDGLPVIIRLLDPPLHEFLPAPRDLAIEVAVGEATGKDVTEAKKLLAAADHMAEMNPMLGLRGCRLGIVMPGLSAMQVRAIAMAAARLVEEGYDPRPEVMIPLVSMESELKYVRKEAEEAIRKIEDAYDIDLSFIEIGTMIELPRAAVTADEIAKDADFFSFGTNDLTQTTFGFSRDDVEGKFFNDYEDLKIMKVNPFATVDDGVVKLVDIAAKGGRSTNPDLMLGVCGEHGGDPDSIHKFQKVGLNYVSCSPYRVPLARLAAAQAALAEENAVVADK